LQRRTAVDEMIQRLRDAHARATADKATLGDLVIAANPIIDALPQLLDRLSAAEARVKVLEGERDRLELCRDAAIDVSLAAFNLLADMKAYEAWERPCHAVSRLEGALGCWQSAAAAAARAEKEGDRNG
jgi:hypothetical protein